MVKTLFAVKLNKNLSKFLAFTNINNSPATASQSTLDFAVFFETREDASNAITAYLNSPNCKMSKDNAKFISIESFDFECAIKDFPFSGKYTIIKKESLMHPDQNNFNNVYLEYEDFKCNCYINRAAYRRLFDSKKRKENA